MTAKTLLARIDRLERRQRSSQTLGHVVVLGYVVSEDGAPAPMQPMVTGATTMRFDGGPGESIDQPFDWTLSRQPNENLDTFIDRATRDVFRRRPYAFTLIVLTYEDRGDCGVDLGIEKTPF